VEELGEKKNDKVKLKKPSILMVFRVPTPLKAKKGYEAQYIEYGYGNLDKPH
jgi:hypothetical protein